MITSKTYFVEIKPTGYYFFGNERTFNTTKKDKYEKEITNYFAQSNALPQQTAILGMLRYALLVITNELNAVQSDKEKTIGEFAFNGKHTESYGFIKSISPLVIAKQNIENKSFKFLLPAPFTKQESSIEYKTSAYKSFTNNAKTLSAVLENFDYKKFNTDLHWSYDNGTIEKDIFKELTKVGVRKKSTEDGFYKQTFYGLKNNFSFGVWLTLTESAAIDLNKPLLVPFGADQGLFKITFHDSIDNIFEQKQETTNTILLLSDALIDKDFFDDVDFGINDFTDFRYIQSRSSDYYNPNKSGKLDLLKRGSVLFTNNAKTISEKLRAKTAYRNIGYNYFKFI